MKIRKTGFTLIELIVVITIIAIMAGISIYRFMDIYDTELESAANALQSALIRARDLARAPQQGDPLTVDLDVNGSGILFPTISTPNIELTIFKDKIDANQNLYNSPGDITISTTRFTESNLSRIRFSAFSIASSDPRSIVFRSNETPSGERVYFQGSPLSGSLIISLQHTITGKIKTVTISSSGNIF